MRDPAIAPDSVTDTEVMTGLDQPPTLMDLTVVDLPIPVPSRTPHRAVRFPLIREMLRSPNLGWVTAVAACAGLAMGIAYELPNSSDPPQRPRGAISTPSTKMTVQAPQKTTQAPTRVIPVRPAPSRSYTPRPQPSKTRFVPPPVVPAPRPSTPPPTTRPTRPATPPPTVKPSDPPPPTTRPTPVASERPKPQETVPTAPAAPDETKGDAHE